MQWSIEALWDYSRELHSTLLWAKLVQSNMYRRLQLLMLAWENNDWFNFIGLPQFLLNRLTWILKSKGYEFVSKTVWKSRPSIYFCTSIPNHVDTEVRDTYWIVFPLVSSWFDFIIDWEKIVLNPWTLYIFDHSKDHSILQQAYEEWLAKWWKPFVCITWSVNILNKFDKLV